MTILFAFISALIIMMPSLIGAVFIRKGPATWMARNIHYLASFSIGIFCVITWTLFGEAVEHIGYSNASLFALLGAIAILLAARLIPDNHHHHEIEAHTHTPVDARRLLMSDAVHNVSDGFILVPAYLAGPAAGIVATLAIVAHELVQETAKFFILKEAGYSNREALTKSFIAASSILFGVAAAATLASIEGAEALFIAFAAGGFLYLIVRDLVPNAMRAVRRHGKAALHVSIALIGVLLMMGITITVPHSHEHAEQVVLTK